jgi:hypothetical protein
MRSTALRLTLVLAAVGLWSAALNTAAAESDAAALVAALKDASATLQGGIKASERAGTPISAKFEIENGMLQLSVYTTKDSVFTEVIADPNTGAITREEKITDADDLKAATAQKTAMSKTKVTLLAATERAVKANIGSRAISIYPQLENGHAVAEVTLLQGTTPKKVIEKLD